MLYKKLKYNINNLIGRTTMSTIAVAVSGGSDSIALLLLTHKWVNDNNINLVVMSVDHNLRQQSKLENEYVKDLANKLGHNHFQLHFNHKNNFANLQARAREGRYKLMTNLCHKLDISTILTAHHLDDYIENFFIRLERKSSIFGLSSNYINWYNNVKILRPLFNIPKQQLIDYLITNNIKWFEDESNLLDKYKRNVIRKKLAIQSKDFKDNILNKQLCINKQVEEFAKPQFITAIAESIKIYEFGFAVINLLKLSEFTKVIKLQLINFTLVTISGNNSNIRYNSINLILDLLSNEKIDFIKTLHGCIIKKIGINLLIYREFGRVIPNNIILNNDNIWDSRFRFKSQMCLSNYHNNKLHNLSYSNNMDIFSQKNYIQEYPLYITNLKMQDYNDIKKFLNLKVLQDLTFNNGLAILFTLPVIKVLEKVIAMPHISYYDDKAVMKKYDIFFEPGFISRFTHFC